MNNLKAEHNSLVRRGEKATGALADKSFESVSLYSATTMKQAFKTSISLPASVIATIASRMNGKYPELILNNKNLNGFGARSVNDVVENIDCRVFVVSSTFY